MSGLVAQNQHKFFRARFGPVSSMIGVKTFGSVNQSLTSELAVIHSEHLLISENVRK